MTFKMLCDNCEKAVETEYKKFESPDEAERLDARYGEYEIDGPFELTEVGEVKEYSSTTGTVGARVDFCADCGNVLRVWTYIR